MREGRRLIFILLTESAADMTKNITVERHLSGWCIKDAHGNCLLVTADRQGLDRIVQQMGASKTTDKWRGTREGGDTVSAASTGR